MGVPDEARQHVDEEFTGFYWQCFKCHSTLFVDPFSAFGVKDE